MYALGVCSPMSTTASLLHYEVMWTDTQPGQTPGQARLYMLPAVASKLLQDGWVGEWMIAKTR